METPVTTPLGPGDAKELDSLAEIIGTDRAGVARLAIEYSVLNHMDFMMWVLGQEEEAGR